MEAMVASAEGMEGGTALAVGALHTHAMLDLAQSTAQLTPGLQQEHRSAKGTNTGSAQYRADGISFDQVRMD